MKEIELSAERGEQTDNSVAQAKNHTLNQQRQTF
jgi:hypothetical protein